MILNPSIGGGSGGGLPKGIICAWSGAQDAIPAGWVLCDGDNGTPDLRGRFVLGAGDKYKVNDKGGEETHKLTVSEMPSHTHNMPPFKTSNTNPYIGQYQTKEGGTGGPTYWETGSTGGNDAHNNMPPYWALCWIMKT